MSAVNFRRFFITLAVLFLLPNLSHAATAEETAKSYFDEGMEMNKLRRFDEAIEKLTKAVRLRPDSHKYHQGLFITYLSTQRGIKAIEVYKGLVREFPKSGVVHYWLGRLYLQSGSLNEAAREFKESTRLAPKDDHPWISLGHVYWRMGKDAEALPAYLEANRLAPNVASVHGGLGNIYLKQKQWEKARKEFEEALRLDPSTTEIRYNLSLIYEKNGRIDQAVQEWEKILEDDPNETVARERLARFYYKTEKFADAVREYGMLSQLRQSSPEVYLALGESQIMWAAALEDSGERAQLLDEAAESFQHVLKFDPKNEEAGRYLDRLRSKQPAAGPGGASAETVYDCNAPENKDQPTTIEFVLAKKAQNSTAEIKEVFRSNHPTTKVRVRIFPFLDPPANIGIGKCVAADQARKAIGEAMKYYGKLDRLIRQDVLPHHWVKIGSTDVAELAWTPVGPDDLTRLSDPALTTEQFQDLYRQLAAPKEKKLPFGMGTEKIQEEPKK